ncbi:lachrymatory-factor synthase-like [Telopea speciosissima]|uniref:lachrymatory-factor synthase-like n=1 Tax=Telopea speciosissima TaxID=54955 RepID=UPI001CC3E7A3|nr:lachrymatory-factor synthase-like [Telopea speciosissima]
MATEESSQSEQLKWEGKLSAELKGATADQVWPLLEDFFNIHKWFPGIDTCKALEGVSGQPGCIRYCVKSTATTSVPAWPESEEKMMDSTVWAKERLVAIDPVERWLRYEVAENNIGMKSYMATIKVLQLSKPANEGCQIEWSFVSDPVEGLTFEGFLSYLESILQGMAQRMEEALCPNPTSL